MNIDQDKLHELLGKFVGDLGATMSAGTIVIGEKLGLYKAMGGPNETVTAKELAARTDTNERYVREWLNAQASSGYVEYDAESDAYYMTDEQAFVLTNEHSAAYLPGAFVLATSALKATPKITERFKTGEGLGWHEHDEGLFCGTELFFRPGYATHLINEWIPSLQGIEERLKEGGKIADVGCGHGASTILMAQAYPNSKIYGFDYHEESIKTARRKAEEAGVSDRVTFEVAKSKEFPGEDYDLVTFFDCLHDMGDPVGAAAHVKESLSEGGSWMIVEPFAGDNVEDNLNPVGRIYYSASTLICTPASLSQEVGLALGAQAGEERLRNVAREGGFGSLKRTAETPFNIILEARAS
ncbi:MAG: methyltransferase domain-containing protein [Acidobacteria bacterium]|nr:MAG: methyltransferase domain-containing protein [Acidobacteriota bacterium]REK02812.1 MAG: methyltransferase domain-containing protein [Acidobacteriota bacterium]REK13384.1 MAG: methyltransferase domain-containing protein [Acidobacteriota bacterium]REK41378.1 MAG: methyltransferase domain-containing protein [Acidobacteriota bacterium]